MRIDQLSDLLSPILIKELRQGRRSRVLTLLAVLTFVAAGLIFLLNEIGDSNDHGRGFFSGLYACLSLVGFLILPFMAHRSLVREQEAGSWQLLQLTGLGPRRIIAGKLMSSLVQMGVLSLAVIPFLVPCVLINKMDVQKIAMLCAGGAAMTGALTVVALFAATLPRTRVERSFIQVALLLGLVLGMGTSLSIVNHQARQTLSVSALVTALWAIGATSYTLFEAAAARLALVAEDYAWRPRLALVVQLAGLTALGLWNRWSDGASGIDGKACALIAVAIIACGSLGMATEADHAGPPSRRRGLASLFAPGALTGFRLTVLLLAATAELWFILLDSYATRVLVAAPAYVVLYLSAAIWIGRALARRFRFASPDATRVVFVVLAGLGTLVPWIFAKSIVSANYEQMVMGLGLPNRFPLGFISPAYGLPMLDWFNLAGPCDVHWISSIFHWILLALAVVAGLATDRLLARRLKT